MIKELRHIQLHDMMSYLKAVVASLVLCFTIQGCDKEMGEPESTIDDNSIGFNAGVEKTRAVATIDHVKSDGFYVWGGYDGNSTFRGEHVTYSNASWGYENTKYWNTTKIYNFYAFYLAGLSNSNIKSNADGSFIIENFDIQSNTLAYDDESDTYSIKDVDERKDILRASMLNVPGSNKPVVEMQFTHMLTQMELYAVTESGTATINVKIYGIPKVANYIDLTDTWETTTPSTSSAPFISKSDILVGTTSTNLLDGHLWIAPAMDNNTVINIEYNQNGTIRTKEIHLLAYGNWEPGKKYKYTFTIIDDGTILFDTPKVVPWDRTNGSIIIID